MVPVNFVKVLERLLALMKIWSSRTKRFRCMKAALLHGEVNRYLSGKETLLRMQSNMTSLYIKAYMELTESEKDIPMAGGQATKRG